MGERRKTWRYDVYLPLQVCLSQTKSSEFYDAQLRDVSRTGVYFHSNVEIKQGAGMELTFALPGEKARGTSVLIRATAKALRVHVIRGDVSLAYGVAATIDHIDFVRPAAAVTAA
jgi:hypothetical protein